MKRLWITVFLVLLLTGCAGQATQNVTEEHRLAEAGAFTLSDGTVVDRWITDVFENSVYKTADGWELLWVPLRVDIANVGVPGMEGFGHLNETAQAQVRTYYDAKMPELDIPALLEAAWQDCNTVTPERGMFKAWWAHQEVFPVAYNDAIMCFAVETSVVGSDRAARIERVHTIFSRENGEVLEIWDLFKEEPDAVKACMAQALARDNNLKYEELRAGLELENVVRLRQGGLEFFFPAGSLSWVELDCYMDLDCDDLPGLWHDWAVTEQMD